MQVADLWWRILEFSKRTYSLHKDQLSEDSRIHVQTYFDAGEYEMLLESLLLAFIESDVALNQGDIDEAYELCIESGISQDSVFVNDFFQRFLEYRRRTMSNDAGRTNAKDRRP